MSTNDSVTEAPQTGRQTVLEMIRLQRRIFERQRAFIEANECHLSRGFARYRNAYYRATSTYDSISGFGALCDAISEAAIAYIADYHTLQLAQRTFVKILNGVMQQAENLCICLEFVQIEYQDALDKFMTGRLCERTFLKRIHYKDHWPYDIWPNFKPVFQLAMDRGIPVIAIDSDPSLPLVKRDQLAAKRLYNAAIQYPQYTLIVYTGQMHITPSHLPRAVERCYEKANQLPPKRVIVYQNAEEIYWRLAEERREGVEVVRVDQESFCVNNTPPLVQQLSYLHWLNYDEEFLEHTELSSTVRTILRTLGRFLQLPYVEALKQVRILMPGDLDLIEMLQTSELTELEKRQIRTSVEAEQSACFPTLNTIYLSGLSLNHAAEEAAHYLKQRASGSSFPTNLKDAFYYYIMNEACGFFGSKVINPKRKTEHQGKLRRIVAAARHREGKRTDFEKGATFALAHISFEQIKKTIDSSAIKALRSPGVFNAAAHILGYILGDRLYYGLTSGMLSKGVIKKLFLAPLNGPGEAIEAYFQLQSLTRNVRIPNRI